MRNRYPGICYRCGKTVAAGEGHFERHNGGWRTQHADCCIKAKEEKQEKNTMTYEQALLYDLQDGPVHFTDKRAVGRRMPVLNDLQSRGLITMELVEVDDQESYLEVRLKEKK